MGIRRFLQHSILLLIVSTSLLACSVISPGKNQSTLYWPAAPSEPRLVYEATLRSPASLKDANLGDRIKELMGKQQPGSTVLMNKPYDVAAKDGLVVVSDTRMGLVHVYDVPRRRMFPIGWRGEAVLQKPLGVAVDNARNIYVADAGHQAILVFNMLGHFKRTIGRNSGFSRLSDVVVSPSGDRVYAVDRGGIDSDNHRITVFSQHGEMLFRIGQRGVGDGEFNHPIQAALDKQGNLYVLDAGNFRVQVFARDGRFLRAWGKPGKHLGNLARPRGLAVDNQNHVYVTDAVYQNFQIFDEYGHLLLPVGEGAREDAPGQYILPAGIAVDETDRIYIVDQIMQKVDVMRLLSDKERTMMAGEAQN
ncbi:MAG: 6-bladed beta-propeller [Gammaproteobacteria bacterium]|nr:6-bladed beta-propeller [Gammaproteobacteria bacterium]MDH5730329.1 6-bladed beta-propeller [Gammaproteobacteria bacterium]